MDPQEDRHIIVFGLDFGTTYSGVTWAYSKDSESVAIITSWPTQQSQCSDKEKTPSKVSFDNNDVNRVSAWGYNATEMNNHAKWFKLLLLEEENVPIEVVHSDEYREAVQFAQSLGKSPVELIASYLRQIWLHTLDEIERSDGANFLEICRFHIVVTLPAIWPDYTRKRMGEALKQAGILDRRDAGSTTYRFISEPEAAALASFIDMGNRPTFQRGQTMVICDAGGGTVDLITYFIQQVQPFVVKEIVQGDGDLCGGVFLDQEFIKFIKGEIGEENWDLLEDTEKQKFLNLEWENGIKPQFYDKEESKEWHLTVPLPRHGSSDDSSKRIRELKVSTKDLRQVFEPVTGRITDLVSRQGNKLFAKTSKAPDHVVLVGGFGRCRHLYNSLQTVADGFGAALLQPKGSKPWSAISRGAVVHGLTKLNIGPSMGVTVSSRVARISYGVKYTTEFIKDEHYEEDKEYYPSENIFKAINQVQWFLRKGDNVDDHKPVDQKYYNILNRQMLENLRDTPIQIYSTEAWPAPTRTKDERVVFECEMEWADIVDYDSLPIVKNPKTGVLYRRLEYSVRVKYDLGEMQFFIVLNGEEYSSQTRVKVDLEI